MTLFNKRLIQILLTLPIPSDLRKINSLLHRPMVTGGEDAAAQEVAGEGCSRSLLSCPQAPKPWQMMGRLQWGHEFALMHEAWLFSVGHAMSC